MLLHILMSSAMAFELHMPCVPARLAVAVVLLDWTAAVQAFGGDLTDAEVEGLFQQAGEQQRGRVGVDALADLLQQHVQQNNLFKIIKRCNLFSTIDNLRALQHDLALLCAFNSLSCKTECM